MDDLLSLIVMIVVIMGIAQSFSSQKKKRGNGQSASTSRSAGPRIPYAASKASPRSQTTPVRPAPSAKPAVKAAKPTVKAAKPAVAAAPAAAAAVPAAAMAAAPEGSISTQGEHPEAHALHQARIAAQEAQLRREWESMAELRNIRLENLRAAVVMSEVLGKPVALRPRNRY